MERTLGICEDFDRELFTLHLGLVDERGVIEED
jgi:hypothetical protein